MGFWIVSGAMTQCTFGAAPGTLNVLPINKAMVGGPPAANDDKPWWSVLSNLAPGAQASAGDTPRPGRRGRRVRSGGL